MVEGEEELIEAKKDTTIKHGNFLLANLVKKYPIWIGVKKTTSSFWTSRFQHVHCEWAGFFYW